MGSFSKMDLSTNHNFWILTKMERRNLGKIMFRISCQVLTFVTSFASHLIQ